MEIETMEVNELFPGVFLLKMPLPVWPNHVNLYLLEDIDGWYLVDTGLNTDLSRLLWEKFLSSGFFTKPILKIVLTHLHADQIGMSAWLSDTLKVPVAIAAGEWAMARFLWDSDTGFARVLYERYWNNFGVPRPLLSNLLALRMSYKQRVKALPQQVEIVMAHDMLMTYRGNWEFLPGFGHSPEHMCLWNAQSRMLISGDHILPNITPNICFHPAGLVNPLESYLQSLDDFSRYDCHFYLPARGPVSRNYRDRIDEITLHHQINFAELMNKLPQCASVYDAMPLIFNSDFPQEQLMRAYAETAAHLLCLAERGLLQRDERNSWLFINNTKNTTQKTLLGQRNLSHNSVPC